MVPFKEDKQFIYTYDRMNWNRPTLLILSLYSDRDSLFTIPLFFD